MDFSGLWIVVLIEFALFGLACVGITAGICYWIWG